jgi:hypothetical protein
MESAKKSTKQVEPAHAQDKPPRHDRVFSAWPAWKQRMADQILKPSPQPSSAVLESRAPEQNPPR